MVFIVFLLLFIILLLVVKKQDIPKFINPLVIESEIIDEQTGLPLNVSQPEEIAVGYVFLIARREVIITKISATLYAEKISIRIYVR